MATTLTIEVPRNSQWIADELESIIDVKSRLGYSTDMSFEACRLLREGLIGDREELLARAKKYELLTSPWTEDLAGLSRDTLASMANELEQQDPAHAALSRMLRKVIKHFDKVSA